MKPKILKKKLSLNKTTIANINEEAMDKARGGVSARCLTGVLIFTCPLPCATTAVCPIASFCACIFTVGGPNCPR